MNTDSIPPLLPGELPPIEAASGLERFRESAAESLFFLSRNFPKLLTLRSTPRAWTAFRVMLGFAGAALVVLPLSLWNAWAFAPVGLALFLLAVLLPPLKHDRGTAQTIQQLGAYQVMDAGRFVSGTEEASAVQFYLTLTRVWVLNQQLHPLAVIPVNEIDLATAYPSGGDWVLRLSWKENSAEFFFAGLFAERRARRAETGLRPLVQANLIAEELPRRRVKAAGA
jgi:hypothetical protein